MGNAPPLGWEDRVTVVGCFLRASDDEFIRANHHLYNTDGAMRGTPAKAMVAAGYAPAEFHHQSMAARAAIYNSDS